MASMKKKSVLIKKKKSSRTALSTSIFSELPKNIWPHERDLMERPDRMKYVRKLIHAKGCVFCQSRDSGVHFKSLCIYKGKHAMVVLNKFPYNTGHLLILPIRHCADTTGLSTAEYNEVSQLLRISIEIVKSEYKVSGINIGMNMGAIAGAGIPDHMHWHIVPRWFGDTNFFPLIAETKALPETLKQSYNRYQKHFKKLRIIL